MIEIIAFGVNCRCNGNIRSFIHSTYPHVCRVDDSPEAGTVAAKDLTVRPSRKDLH